MVRVIGCHPFALHTKTVAISTRASIRAVLRSGRTGKITVHARGMARAVVDVVDLYGANIWDVRKRYPSAIG